MGTCVNTAPLSFSPPTVLTSFVTTVDGAHKLFVAVADYDTGVPFPTRGTILTATDAVGAPSVDISAKSWLGAVSVKLVQVVNAYKPGEKADTVHCAP